MKVLSRKERTGRIMASRKDVLRAYRELNRARLYAQSYPKNCLAQIRLSDAEKVLAEALEKNFGCRHSREALRKAENALTAYLAARKKAIKISRDKVLWNLLDLLESGEYSLEEYYALERRLNRYGFTSRKGVERFLKATNVKAV